MQPQLITGFSELTCSSLSCERKSKSKASLDTSRRKLESLRTKKSLIPQSSFAPSSSKLDFSLQIQEYKQLHSKLHENANTYTISNIQQRREPSQSLISLQNQAEEKLISPQRFLWHDRINIVSNVFVTISLLGFVGNFFGFNLPYTGDAKVLSGLLPVPLSFLSAKLSANLSSFTTNNMQLQQQQLLQTTLQFIQTKILPVAKDSLQKMLWMEFWRRSWHFVHKKLLKQMLHINPWESPKWLKKFPSIDMFFRRGTRKLMEKDIQKKVQNGLAMAFERIVMSVMNGNKSIGLSPVTSLEAIAM